MNIYEEKINKLNVEIKKLKLNQEKKLKILILVYGY